MKKVLLLFSVLLAISCSNKEDVSGVQEVHFNIYGLTYQVVDSDQDKVQRKSTPTEEGLTDIWVIEGTNTLLHKKSSDSDFDSPTIILTTGQHTLTFIGSNKSGQQVVNGVWSANKIGDTYGCVHQVNVQSGMAIQNVTLGRVNYVIQWSSTDVVPDNAVTIELSVDVYRNTLLSGLAGGAVNPSYSFSASSASVIGSTLTMSSNAFCTTFATQENVSTTLKVKDSGGNVLYSHTKEVPVLSNRKTIISGELFGGTKSSVSVENDWLDDYEVAL